MFKDGDEVIIITEDDDYLWGSVTAINAGAILSRSNKEDKLVPWEDIRFMSHDGFPVKKLMGADGSNLIELLDTTDTQEAIRQALAYKKICKVSNCHKEVTFNSDECHDHLVFGDPFIVENFDAFLVNKGNTWEYNDPYKNRYEETIVMQADNGRMGMLWDIPTCYKFETKIPLDLS